TQTIEVVLANPVLDIPGEKVAHWPAVLAVEVDGVSPLRRLLAMEVVVGELRQIIPIRTDVVVHNIENHSQADAVSVINKAAEVVGRAITRVRSVQINAVITPPKLSRETRHRHYFNHSDAEIFQQRQFLFRGFVNAGGSKCAYVQLVDNLPTNADSAPVLV